MGRDQFDRALSPLVTPASLSDSADWIGSRLLPWLHETGTKVCSVVPEGFDAYCRILHPAHGPPPDRQWIRWSTAAAGVDRPLHAETQWETIEESFREAKREPIWHEEPMLGVCPSEVIVPLHERLMAHTTTPDVIWFAMWVGYPDVLAVAKGAARFELPGREYALFRGPLEAAEEIITSPYTTRASPSLWWPDDRAWCVATEIDFRWTYVGGTDQCIGSLEREHRLEVFHTEPHHRGDIESDWP
jgi:hypothetical protein